jgi:hypothetical protein
MEAKDHIIPSSREVACISIDVNHLEITEVHFAQIFFCQQLESWCSKRTLLVSSSKLIYMFGHRGIIVYTFHQSKKMINIVKGVGISKEDFSIQAEALQQSRIKLVQTDHIDRNSK